MGFGVRGLMQVEGSVLVFLATCGGCLAVALVLGVVVLGGLAVASVRWGLGGGRVVDVGGLWRARGGCLRDGAN